ncbi:4-alpha-glucanotransferase [Solimonas marina]|uniref:4-alpha-glucanotransferase n=1 Tax=Solimonas marina TaxID=2714601 RepID=A0A969WBL1_9GAMM|nr:4-alpha-glucanotransferase [Solimonas marina]NKF23110.1 4-alpha-glucanotransferase [Solimonas marina]
MSDDALRRLAERAGIASNWTDYRGVPRVVGVQTLRTVLDAMELPCGSDAQIADSEARLANEQQRDGIPPLLTAVHGQSLQIGGTAHGGGALTVTREDGGTQALQAEARDGGLRIAQVDLPPGYHRLHIGERESTLAVAPNQAFGVRDASGGRRVWGLAAQLYGLRRDGGGGLGDFTALRDLVEQVAARGGDALAISPVHALFAADPGHFSPYSPSSRLFLNILHADPALAIGSDTLRALIDELGVGDTLQRLESQAMVDWPAASRTRLALLRASHAQLAPRLADATDPLGASFARFVVDGGEALLDHARFEALHAEQVRDGRWSWLDWPAALRDPRAAAVAAFADAHADTVQFHLYAQWLAARGLAAVQTSARESGMAIGLIADLAVGTSNGGSHAWSRQREMLTGLSVGAPPDLLNALGQSWGLSTFSPRALRQHGYGAFIEMLRANLRHAGGLRVDHILGMRRMWLVPQGADPIEGAYLQFPLHDMLQLIALESHRHRAVIVGEDLGTVPDGFRDELYRLGIMGMRVLWFERDYGLFVEPSRWPTGAMATTTTHDLPTVAGWWQGRDIDWRARLKLYAPGMDEAQDRAERDEDRKRLWGAFQYAGVTDLPVPPAPEHADAAIDAAVRFVGKTPSPLAIVPIEDIAGLVEQPNVPGTVDEHPNWCRRLPADAATLLATPDARRRLDAIGQARQAAGD